ncbi:MAG: DUF2153 family protein [Desulfurococcales archaeon]|nr:DUF2153 family protein [Desulfurococcales archaeon]
MSSSTSRILASLNSLSEWVEMQKRAIEIFRNLEKQLVNADRLTLVLMTRQAFQHMIKTLKAFDQWLTDPFILNYITKDMLIDVWETTFKLLNELLELDIRHTQAVKKAAEKMIKEGRLPPILSIRRSSEEESERRAFFPL